MKKLWILLAALVALAAIGAPAPGAQAQAPGDTPIVLTQAGSVVVTVMNVVTNDCNGETGLMLPNRQVLFSDVPENRGYNHHRGETVTLGPFAAGTELVFYITPWRYCGNDTNAFTYRTDDDPASFPHGKSHARVTPLQSDNSWRIDFEDLPESWDPPNGPDFDYNDLTLVVRLEGSVPDYQQDDPAWSGDTIGDTNIPLAEGGCAVTAAADILNYYGSITTDPATLDACLSRADVRGYLTAADDPNCAPGGDAALCNAGALRWAKLGACSIPTNPMTPGATLVKFIGKYNLDGKTTDPASGKKVTITKELLKRLIDADLAIHRPVILEVTSPHNPAGVHYVVARAKSGSTYTIHDPDGAGSTLDDYNDALVGIIRYAPADGVFRQSLMVNGFGDMELSIYDPRGRRTGYSPYSRVQFNDLPESGYYFQRPIANDRTSALLGSGMPEIYVNDPLEPGRFTTVVVSKGGGDYALAAQFQDNPLVTRIARVNGALDPLQWAKYSLTIRSDADPTLIYEPFRMFLPHMWRGKK